VTGAPDSESPASPLGTGGERPARVRRDSRVLLLLLLVLALAWLWLSQVVLVVAQGDAGHDDALFVRLASSIANGRWLGPYDERTLIKGAGYPLFLGACAAAGVPAHLAQGSLHVAASALAVWALGPLLRRRSTVALVFAVVLAQPLPYPFLAREAIYPDLSLATMALVVGILLRADASPRQLAAMASALGAVLGALWITREEGAWIVPALLVALLLIVWRWGRLFRACPVGPGRRILALLPAVATFLSVVLAIRTANFRAYGVFTGVETVSEPFVSAYGALSRVDHRSRRRFVPVPREVREAVYRVSPSLRSVRAGLEGDVGAFWGRISCESIPSTCGDIGGGWFQWALRDAAARTGQHRTATVARAFYLALADEVNRACERGDLPCGPARSTMAPVETWSVVGSILRDPLPVATAFTRWMSVLEAYLDPRWSSGTEDALRPFQEVARGRLAPVRTLRVTVRGWAFSADGGPVDVALQEGAHRTPAPDVVWSDSPDVAETFGNPLLARCRFSLTGACGGDCALTIQSPGGEVGRTVLPEKGSFRPAAGRGVEAWVDEVAWVGREVRAGTTDRLDRFRRRLLRAVARAYRFGLPVATGMAVVAALAAGWIARKRKKSPLPSAAAAVLFLAVASRVGLVEVVNRTSFPTSFGYLLPAVPVLILFVVASLLSLSEALEGATPGERRGSPSWSVSPSK